jgi:enoyl-CoA hydratase/carnithine racemase
MATVLYEKRNRLVIITLNRPEVLNCIDPATDKKMAEAWNRFKEEAVLRGIGEPLTEGLRIEAMLFNTLIGTHDFSEGPSAFAEKRNPRWKND